MSPEAQRIAIATHLFPQFPVFKTPGGELRHDYEGGRSGPVYDYPHDLNSMRDAVLALNEAQKERFTVWLGNIVIGHGSTLLSRKEMVNLLEASAWQWAEAFVRTIGEERVCNSKQEGELQSVS